MTISTRTSDSAPEPALSTAPPMRRILAIVGLFSVVCLVWATTWIGIKLTIQSIPPLTAAGVRFLITFPILFAIAKASGSPLLFPKGRMKFFIFITVFYFSVPYFLMNFGEKYIAPGLAALIFSTMPIFSLIFSVLLLRTRTNVLQVIGIVIGFVGFAALVRNEVASSQGSSVYGILALCAAAIIHGFCYVFTKRFGTNIGVITYNALPIGLAGLAMTIAGLSMEHTDWSAVSVTSWAALFYLAFAAAAGFLSYFYLLKIMSPVMASFAYLIFPILSILIDSETSGRSVSPFFIACTAVIVAGFAVTKLATPR